MKKSRVKNRGIQTEPLKLTEPEMNAALQLIQLSGDSDNSSRDNIYNNAGDSSRVVAESVGDTAEVSSSTAVNMEEKASPSPKKTKFRSVVALYQVTKPLIRKNKHRKFKS